MYTYLCPALMDWVCFFLYFAVLYDAGLQGLTTAQCAWIGAGMQVTYMALSLGTGQVLNRQNARGLLLASVILTLGVGVGMLWVRGFVPLLAAMVLLGALMAVFFNAFQAHMRGEAAPGELAQAVGLYTLAWSGGSALGFLSAGWLYAHGRPVMTLFVAGLCLVMLVLLLSHRAKPADVPSADEHVETGPAGSREVNPGYVWVGWLMIVTVTFVQRPLFTFVPMFGAKAGVSSFWTGLPLFLHMGVLALAGLGLWKCRRWLYRRTPVVVIQVAGILLLLGLWHWPQYTLAATGLTLLGLYAAFAYFCAVYYASNSGRRAFNIGVNEFLVGLGSLAGLGAVHGWLARAGAADTDMYLVCAAALGVSLLAQLVLAGRRNPAAGG
ncbi:MAG: MFS transporter [Lentisphaeria bacterium]